MSASFALATDFLLLAYRGSIKRKERISARMADVVSQLYLASTAVKHFQDQGRQEADEPLLSWAVEDALYRIQQSLDILLANVEPRWMAWVLRLLVFPLGRRWSPPADALDRMAAAPVKTPGAARDRLTSGMYLPVRDGERLHDLDMAFELLYRVAPLEKKLREARTKGLDHSAAVAAGVITESDLELLQKAESARKSAIRVDEFTHLP